MLAPRCQSGGTQTRIAYLYREENKYVGIKYLAQEYRTALFCFLINTRVFFWALLPLTPVLWKKVKLFTILCFQHVLVREPWEKSLSLLSWESGTSLLEPWDVANVMTPHPSPLGFVYREVQTRTRVANIPVKRHVSQLHFVVLTKFNFALVFSLIFFKPLWPECYCILTSFFEEKVIYLYICIYIHTQYVVYNIYIIYMMVGNIDTAFHPSFIQPLPWYHKSWVNVFTHITLKMGNTAHLDHSSSVRRREFASQHHELWVPGSLT